MTPSCSVVASFQSWAAAAAGYWYRLYIADIEAAADDGCPDYSIDTLDCNFRSILKMASHNCVESQRDGSASLVETAGEIGVHSMEVEEGGRVNQYRFVDSVLVEVAAECLFAYYIDEKKTMMSWQWRQYLLTTY